VEAYQQRLEQLSGLAGWQLRGRVAVERDGQGGQLRVVLSAFADGGHRLQVRNAFGQTVLQFATTDSGPVLRDAYGRTFSGEAAWTELERRLGWRVRLDRFARWALGLAEGGAVPGTVDGQGRPGQLGSGLWTVTYDGYQQVDNAWLPKQMTVRYAGYRMRLHVDRWSLRWS
jgi:outer membrane lipoprotein LolB